MSAIGPRDERSTWTNLSWKNETESGDFGTDEFVGFARAAGAEPSITVNVEGRGATVEEAAAWV
jgi:alpha-N-arabinofuranosidase